MIPNCWQAEKEDSEQLKHLLKLEKSVVTEPSILEILKSSRASSFSISVASRDIKKFFVLSN